MQKMEVGIIGTGGSLLPYATGAFAAGRNPE
jgi:hypothetical protein